MKAEDMFVPADIERGGFDGNPAWLAESWREFRDSFMKVTPEPVHAKSPGRRCHPPYGGGKGAGS